MILDIERTTKVIVGWLKGYAKQHDKKAFVVEITQFDPNDIATAIMCKKTRVSTLLVQDTSFHGYEEKGKKVAELLGLPIVQFNVAKFEQISDDVYKELPSEYSSLFNVMDSHHIYSKVLYMMLADLASKYDGLVVGSATKDMLWSRMAQKGCEGDVLPLGDLYFAETLSFLSDEIKEVIFPDFDSAFDPDEDLYEDLCYAEHEVCSSQEMEWAVKQDERTNIVSRDEDPTKHRSWLSYSGPQRRLIAKLHHHEKRTRHKAVIGAPICDIRSLPGLIR